MHLSKMGRNKSPFLLRLLLFVSLVIKSRVLALSIGAILDTNSRIGREQKIAVAVAARKFNTSSQAFNFLTAELKSTDPLQASYDAQLLIQKGAEVIISTGRWPQVIGISSVSKQTKIPTISLTPSAVLSNPLLVQMSYSDTALIKCLARFVMFYKWRRVIMVYEDDDLGSVSATALVLAHELQRVGTRLDYSAVFPPLDSISDPKSAVRAELHRMREHLSSIYIVLRSSENLTLTLFQEATSLGMMERGFAWICGPDVATLLDSTLNTSFILNHMQGVIGIEPYVEESTREYMTFHSDFRQAFKNEYEKNGEETVFNPGVYAARAYDVIQAVILAANNAKVNKNSLVDQLRSSNFTGLSGRVRPTVGNVVEEASGSSAFRVINVVGKSYKEIGFWLDGFGFYNDDENVPLQQLSVVFWPGAGVTPGGLKRLKIGVPATTWDGFVNVEYDNRTGNAKSVSGFCIDVFIAAVSRLNSRILYEFIPFKIGSNFTYDDLVDQVYLKNIDLAIGDITITSNRSEKVSFTEPFVASGLAMIIPLKRDNVGLMLTKPFTPLLWVSIFALLIYKFGAVWYLERNHEDAAHDFHGAWYCQLAATFWIIGNTIFQSYGDRIGNFYTKTVIISWLLVVLIVSACFTANLSSILVTEKLKPVVDKSIAGCDAASFVVNYLERVLNFKPENIVPIINQDEYPIAFENRTITTGYIESPYARVFLSKHNNYAVYGEIHMLGGFGFVLQKDDPMRADLSKEILALAENGAIKHLESKWFSVSLSNLETATNSVDRQSLGLDAFWSLFVFSIGASLITLLTFQIQKHVIANKKKKEQKIAPDLEEEEMVHVPQIQEEQKIPL